MAPYLLDCYNTVMSNDGAGIVNFLFEAGILAKTPRSGFHFLGSGQQSVAEHTLRTALVGYALASTQEGVDADKVMKMCLLHDFAEGRTSDLNYVHQKYVVSDEEKAIDDLVRTVPFGDDMKRTLLEYKERSSKEALLAKDADVIEWILALKEQLDIGNERAKDWILIAQKRLKTKAGKALAKQIITTDSNDWWLGDKDDDWWVHRSGDALKKRF